MSGVWILFCLAAPVRAHPLSVSYSHWIIEGRAVHATIRLPLDDMDLLLRLDEDLDGTVSDPEIEQAREAIGRSVTDGVQVMVDSGLLVPALQAVSRWKDQENFPYLEAQLTWPASEAIETVTLKVVLLTDLYPAHRTLGEIRAGDRRAEFVFQHGNTFTMTRGMGSRWETAKSFLMLGIEHILTGYDHVLFLFGLLLVGRGFRNVLAIVTAFTVAHSATLSLATLGVIEPTAWIIEAAIALSIAYVGVENLVSRDVAHRWKIAFAFGLIHGFGFANLLREMELPRSSLAVSLFTFNVGVEVGQLAIVAMMLPVLRLLQRTGYHAPVTRYGSVIIIALGLYWFGQRIL